MAQVVVIEEEYGASVYQDDDTVSVVTLDLTAYDDEAISQREYDAVIKRKLDSITIPEAREWLIGWVRENSFEEIEI